jgi:hypothetical protein
VITTYVVLCRGMLSDATIMELTQRGVYRAKGGPLTLRGSAARHQLAIHADDERAALRAAQEVVEACGGSCNYLEVALIELATDGPE